MNADLFFDALNDIHDRYVEETLHYNAPAKRIIRPILRGLAAACLAIIIGFSAVMVVSVEAREIIFGWIREQVDHFTYYTYEEPPENTETEAEGETEDVIYELTLIPEGYTHIIHNSVPGFTHDVYGDSQDRMLTLAYRDYENGLTAFNTENTTMHKSQVHGCEAEIYMANDPSATGSAIVWIENDMLFSVNGFFDMETLIELAESVAVRPKEYALGYIPEGYTLMFHDVRPGYIKYTYGNLEANTMLFFSYVRLSDDWISMIDHEDSTYHRVTVRGVEADLYLPNNPDTDSAGLFWIEDEYMMIIHGFLTQDEIMDLAESVTEVPYPPESSGE